MYNISIVIPVFNENQNISILVEEIFISLDSQRSNSSPKIDDVPDLFTVPADVQNFARPTH